MNTQTIQFGDEGQVATRELVKRFEGLRPEISQGTTPAMNRLRDALKTLEALDRQYGGCAPLPVEDADRLATSIIVDLGHLESDCRRQGFEDLSWDIFQMAVAVALWAIRHGLSLEPMALEHVTNALAQLSNACRTRPELSAVYGCMQGLIEHVRPSLAADLERSNPARPWRLLHANLAITAIRSEDPAMMEHAFDALDAALPEERGNFYAEALALAMNPQIPPTVRERIEERHKRWNLS